MFLHSCGKSTGYKEIRLWKLGSSSSQNLHYFSPLVGNHIVLFSLVPAWGWQLPDSKLSCSGSGIPASSLTAWHWAVSTLPVQKQHTSWADLQLLLHIPPRSLLSADTELLEQIPHGCQKYRTVKENPTSLLKVTKRNILMFSSEHPLSHLHFHA